MKELSLKFLFSRVKRPELTKEQAESKVCQEVFISKLGSNEQLRKVVAFKGGVIIDSLSNGKRGYTKDIDFDFIKYPLTNKGLIDFFNALNEVEPFNNVRITIEKFSELRHKNYKGKRLELVFEDEESTFHLTIDIGVYLPLVKANCFYDYHVVFGNQTRLLINPIERIVAEKISTFAIYGKDNTRDKDLFDAYYLIKNKQCNHKIVKRIMYSLLVSKTHYFKNFELAINEIQKVLFDKNYLSFLNKSKRNWVGESSQYIVGFINSYLLELLQQ